MCTNVNTADVRTFPSVGSSDRASHANRRVLRDFHAACHICVILLSHPGLHWNFFDSFFYWRVWCFPRLPRGTEAFQLMYAVSRKVGVARTHPRMFDLLLLSGIFVSLLLLALTVTDAMSLCPKSQEYVETSVLLDLRGSFSFEFCVFPHFDISQTCSSVALWLSMFSTLHSNSSVFRCFAMRLLPLSLCMRS
jgi:hypothetical protein